MDILHAIEEGYVTRQESFVATRIPCPRNREHIAVT